MKCIVYSKLYTVQFSVQYSEQYIIQYSVDYSVKYYLQEGRREVVLGNKFSKAATWTSGCSLLYGTVYKTVYSKLYNVVCIRA